MAAERQDRQGVKGPNGGAVGWVVVSRSFADKQTADRASSSSSSSDASSSSRSSSSSSWDPQAKAALPLQSLSLSS